MSDDLWAELCEARAEVARLRGAIAEHHRQKADDRNHLLAVAKEWLAKAAASREEFRRIRSTVKAPTDAEDRCSVRAEMWERCAADLVKALVEG